MKLNDFYINFILIFKLKSEKLLKNNQICIKIE